MLVVDSHAHASPLWFEPIEVLLYQMNVNEVAKTVLIQFASNYDNDYLIECLRRFPGRFSACVVVDTNSPDAPARLEDLAARGATGVRLLCKTRSPGSDNLAIWRKAEGLGMTVSLLGSAEELGSDEFHRIVETFPALKIVIEHFGKPGGEQAPYTVYRRALSLAKHPNTYMKLGGLGELCKRLAPFRPPYFTEVPPYIKMAVEAFGPQRLMYGSNFPPVSHKEGYRVALHALMDYLSYLSQDGLQWIFGQTALQAWKFSEK
ncbi:MAG: amidohydrolase [Chloroflexi bacterium]|nr:amidohydrolase [Chloroflexota bacterium]